MLRLFLFIFLMFIFGNNCFSQEVMGYGTTEANRQLDSIMQVRFSKMNLKKIVCYVNAKMNEMEFKGSVDKKGNVLTEMHNFNIRNVDFEIDFQGCEDTLGYHFRLGFYCKNQIACISINNNIYNYEKPTNVKVCLGYNRESNLEKDAQNAKDLAAAVLTIFLQSIMAVIILLK